MTSSGVKNRSAETGHRSMSVGHAGCPGPFSDVARRLELGEVLLLRREPVLQRVEIVRTGEQSGWRGTHPKPRVVSHWSDRHPRMSKVPFAGVHSLHASSPIRRFQMVPAGVSQLEHGKQLPKSVGERTGRMRVEKGLRFPDDNPHVVSHLDACERESIGSSESPPVGTRSIDSPSGGGTTVVDVSPRRSYMHSQRHKMRRWDMLLTTVSGPFARPLALRTRLLRNGFTTVLAMFPFFPVLHTSLSWRALKARSSSVRESQPIRRTARTAHSTSWRRSSAQSMPAPLREATTSLTEGISPIIRRNCSAASAGERP